MYPSYDQGQQIDPDFMNNYYLMQMQLAQAQFPMCQPGHWDMNLQGSDNLSVQENTSSNWNVPAEKTTSVFYDFPQSENYQVDQGQAQFKNSNFSEGSGNQEAEDRWSTRPRARLHLTKKDLGEFGPGEGGEKKKQNQSGFEINIRNVHGLLDEDDDDPITGSGFSGSMGPADQKAKSVENSVFGSFLAPKQGSGWSDTYGSKFNKTKTTRDSTPFQRSFGSTNQPADLNTIFETKEGPFFAMEKPLISPTKGDEYCEGFKIIPSELDKKAKKGFASEIFYRNPQPEGKYYSTFLGSHGTPKLNPILSKGSEEQNPNFEHSKGSSDL